MLAILCAALAMTAGAQQSGPDAKTWAVVVGISKYQKLPGGQQLQFGDRDAALFAETIQKRGVSAQSIKVLTGTEATAAAVKSAIGNWLARSASESDTVLIFFSGHGFFEREFGESYLLAYDSDPKDPYGTALSVGELGQALSRRVRSGRVLVIADAVRRDFFDPESDPDSAKLFEQAFDQLSASRPGVSAIIGSGPGEFSREGQRWGGHGVFTRHLADVLFDGAARHGNLASATDQLFDLLKARIAEDTSAKQHPWRSGATFTQAAATRVEQPAVPTAAVTRNEPDAMTPPPKVAEQSRLSEKTTTEPVVRAEQKRDLPSDKSIPTSPPQRQVGAVGAETRPTKNVRANEKKVEPPRPVVGARRETAPPPRVSEKKEASVPAKNSVKPGSISLEKRTEPTVVAGDKKAETTVVAPRETEPEAKSRNVSRGASSSAAKTPGATSPSPESQSAQPASAKPRLGRSATPPGTELIRSTQPAAPPPLELAWAEVAAADIPAAPKPTVKPPDAVSVSSERATNQPEALTASVPAMQPEAAPTPLILQLEAAIVSKNLIEPRNASAWDFYQRLAADPATSADASRLKPALARALADQGRAIVTADVRGDNISEKVDDFKRAGQMLARARALAPDNTDVIALEKLSAAEALIALQFYDEAERALGQLQSAKLAAVENALGLVHHGKLDTWRAERAFKRAIELDPKWAAPHYNLALLYRSQQNQASLEELEAAAALDPTNLSLLAALGDECFTRQHWKQAAEAFRKAVALKPSDDTLHTKLGHALYSQGLQDEANREYQKARELRGKQP